MTILILVDQFYLHGGIEKLVGIKANYWAVKFGYKIVIISTEQQNNKFVYPLSDKIIFEDLDINYKRSISFFHPKNLKKLYTNFKKIKNKIDIYNPDFILVASHLPMTYLLPYLKTKAKIIKEFHYSKSTRLHSKKENFFSKIESKYDYLVVLSAEERKFYPSKNTVIIPNPIAINPHKIDLKIKNNNKIAAAILRFAPVKQLDKMVEVWEKFYKKNLDWKLYLYGDTNEAYCEEIKQLVAEKELLETIIFKGNTEDVYKALEEVNILLMTSANECFPMVILESNSCGVPVISFDSPTGPRNIIHNEIDGFIIPLNNINTFVEKLDKFANNLQMRTQMSVNALKNVENFQLDKIMNIWQTEIFEKR